MDEKKQDFVVSDRRRFGDEGELRPGNEQAQDAVATPTASAVAAEPATVAPVPTDAAVAGKEQDELPEPPTAEEQHVQHESYKSSAKKLDDLFATKLGAQGSYPEMNFDKVIESFYMSALIQMGAIRQEGETPQVDIIGARQTIDSITVLQEKTKGNLTDREQTLVQNVLFELRMAWIELTNAIAARAANPPTPMVPPQK
jgi:uncharacterized protein DUF1844